MRIDRLDLLAFGPFTNRAFEFAPGRVELIYGPNGAGKSSTLRGLTALLYGIPMRTTDAHVHEMKELRIGALLRENGAALEVVRRKTRKDSLLGADDRPIDEHRVAQLLDGVGEELFKTMFALNHERLRQGGHELLEGTGDLAEQLFGAGLGRDIHEVLAGLRSEEEALFTARGRTKALHQAISEYKDTKKSLRALVLRPDEWAAAQRELEEKEAERAASVRSRRARRRSSATARSCRCWPGTTSCGASRRHCEMSFGCRTTQRSSAGARYGPRPRRATTWSRCAGGSRRRTRNLRN
jgi:uncharacterized protein YhaN